MALTYKTRTASWAEIHRHLEQCDQDFVPVLSSRVDLLDYSRKISEKAVSFEAWDGSALVGMVNAYLNDTRTRAGFITNVSVLKGYARRGVASALLAMCLEHARQTGFSKIRLQASPENQPALRLYSRAGFVVVAETADHLLMECDVGSGSTEEQP